MKKSLFQASNTGTLVRTEFSERDASGNAVVKSGEAFVPSPLPPPIDRVQFLGELHDVLVAARTNLLRLEASIESLPCKTALLAALTSREAQASSKIENTIAPLRDIALARAIPDRAEDSTLEVVRNRIAIDFALSSSLPLSGRLAREMHRVLVPDPSKRPGKYRDLQVSIGDKHRGFEHARFVPPPPSHIEQCMKDWELYVNPGAINAPPRERLDPLVEIAFAHYQFETIHPFSDGNGRLGRALITIAGMKSGLFRQPVCNLSEWVHDHRQEYYDGLLRVSTHGDWSNWTRFFCTALRDQAHNDLDRAGRVATLYEKYRKIIEQKRKSVYLAKVLDIFFERQAATIPQLSDALKIKYNSTQNHVEFLLESGILQEHSHAGHAKVFYAPRIIRAIRGKGEE